MTRFQKIRETVIGIVMAVLAILIVKDPAQGYDAVILMLSLWLAGKGIVDLYYYFTMSRFMVGGRMSLYIGVIMLDMGILTASLTDFPRVTILLYLIGIHAFSGLIEILRALEAKRYQSTWKLKMSHGVLNIVIASLCIIFMKNMNTAVIMYCVGLLYSAALRIITAHRTSRVIFIQ